jgi:CRP-like cAMP-binding protein
MMDLEIFRISQTSVPTPESMEAFAAGLEAKPSDSINSALFAGMPEEEIQQILRGLPQLTFPGNTKVIEEGDSGDSMYIIKSGRATVIAHLFGKELKLATLETGDVFGEVAFLTGRTRTASVISEGPLEVYEISRFELEEIIDRNPSLLQKLEDFYECRVQDTIKKIQS